jgi:hypothetical protein
MACEAVSAFLTAETGRYMPVLERRVFPRSIWMNIVRRGEWLPAMGTTINTLVYERSAPTDAEPTWTAISTIPDGQEGGSCLPAATKISVASTTRSFSLARRVLEGPDICNIDTMPVFDLYNQLNSTFGILGDYAKIEWEIRYRHEYFRLCQTKVVVDDCTAPTTTTTGASTYPAACADQPLALNLLRRLSIDLMRDGAGAESLLNNNGSPLLTVITDSETSGNIIRANDRDRNDIRWSNQNNLLVRAFGVSYSFQEFVFLNDTFPRRFTCSGGTYTEVPAFTLTSATRGQKAIVNSSWKVATITESFIYFRFDPVDFTGAVTLKNIIDRTCNPDGTVVYHRMHLGGATMPAEPERGVAIAHLRCDPEGCVTTCAS